jgi:hypothetical protein
LFIRIPHAKDCAGSIHQFRDSVKRERKAIFFQKYFDRGFTGEFSSRTKKSRSLMTGTQELQMFYVYQSEYGYTIDVLTSSRATFADKCFARDAGYFPTAAAAWAHVSATYP